MQYIDNDMDDLFRRAAEQYPLAAGKGDWDAVFKKINEDKGEQVNVLPVKKSHYKKNMLITVLLLMSLGQITKQQYEQASTFQHLILREDDRKVKQGSGNQQNNISISNISSVAVATKNIVQVLQAKQKIVVGNYVSLQEKAGVKEADDLHATDNNTLLFADEIVQQKLFTATDILMHSLYRPVDKKGTEIDPVKLSIPTAIILAPKQAIENGDNKSPLPANNYRGLYAGLTAGVDFSKGTSMHFGSAGFDGGLVLGYRFNKSLSVESGISRVTKNYESIGSNFNMDKVKTSMPAGMVINNLTSHSRLVEIPLKVKYDFYQRNKAAFFITGGLTSYILTRESNQYNASVNGAPEKLTGMYKKNSYEIPAAAVFSAGYQHIISQRINIRIEPFLKIPIQGIGIGNLPVTTAGFQFALITSLK